VKAGITIRQFVSFSSPIVFLRLDMAGSLHKANLR
jgi:hypothetical protein